MPGENFVASLAGGQLGGPASDFVIVEWTDSGDSQGEWIAPLHVHHADDEAWFVLQGVLRFSIGDQIYARNLLVMTPRIHALVKALHEPGADDSAATFRAHDSELLS